MTVLIDKTPYETIVARKRIRQLPNDLNNDVSVFMRHSRGFFEPRKIQTLRRMLWNTISTYEDDMKDEVNRPNTSPNELLRSLL